MGKKKNRLENKVVNAIMRIQFRKLTSGVRIFRMKKTSRLPIILVVNSRHKEV